MPRRRTNVPPSAVGEQLRRDAMAYRNPKAGLSQKEQAINEGRAEGLLDAANRVDLWLFEHKGGEAFAVTPGPEAFAPIDAAPHPAPTQAGTVTMEMFLSLQETVGNLAALVAAEARGEVASGITHEVVDEPSESIYACETNRGSHGLARCERAILTAMVQMGGSASEDVLLLLTRYKKSGSWDTAMASLRKAGFVEGTRITGEGRMAVGSVVPLPKGEALIAHWEQKLGACAGAILRLVVQNPEMSETDALEATGYKKSGSWDTAVAKLRKLHLLTPRGDFAIPSETRGLLVRHG